MDKFGVAIVFLAGLVIFLLWHDGLFCQGDLCRAQWQMQIERSTSSVVSPQRQQIAADPASVAMRPATTNDIGAVQIVPTGACRQGDYQFRWRGVSNWCLPQPRSAQSRIIYHSGRLAWLD